MAIYTLVTTGAAHRRQHVTTAGNSDDEAFISAAGEVFTPEHTSIAVARGTGDGLTFLGRWDRKADGAAK